MDVDCTISVAVENKDEDWRLLTAQHRQQRCCNKRGGCLQQLGVTVAVEEDLTVTVIGTTVATPKLGRQ